MHCIMWISLVKYVVKLDHICLPDCICPLWARKCVRYIGIRLMQKQSNSAKWVGDNVAGTDFGIFAFNYLTNSIVEWGQKVCNIKLYQDFPSNF